ncbi:MAG: threonine/serine dehydratase [Candidatus Bathyarchaeota archaeon]|jgi:threonine dehydratase
MQLSDIYAARKRLGQFIRKTPLESTHFLGAFCKGEVWLKLENQQINGSFKVRGALNKIFQLSEKDKNRGIVTASSGNHAQGVGYAAKMLGIKATIFVPENTPEVKIQAIKRYGVKLVVKGKEYMDSERLARDLEAEGGMTFVSPYNDLDVISGQGTIGLEMVEQKPDLDSILVPVGGGGLISGVGHAVKSVKEEIEVIGIQSVASPVMYESIRKGHIVEMDLEDSVAEALHGGIEEDSVTFKMCQDYVDEFILVREDNIVEAIATLLSREHQVAEGAGAVGVAAILENPQRFRGRKIGVIISGANIDEDLLRQVCSRI